MLKIMHLGDLHLDTPFSGLDYSESVKRRAELRNVFLSAINAATENQVKVVLLSGDVFDCEYCTRDTTEFLFSCFEKAKDIRFFISPGNHDPYKYGSPYREFDSEENKNRLSNVHVFKTPEIEAVRLDDLDLTVYGYAFTSESYHGNPLDGFCAQDGGFNVLCGHGDTDNPFSPYAPINAGTLASSGLDYAALGHVHTKNGIFRSGNTVYAYSGCLAGRDFSEHGDKGGIIVSLDNVNGKHEIGVSRIKLCPWSYGKAELDISDTVSDSGIVAKAKEQIEPKDGKMIRLILTGRCAFEPDTDAVLNGLKKLGVTEIENEAKISFDFLGLSKEYGIRGEFYRTLLPMLGSEDERVRKRAALALKLGLRSLDGEELKF